MASVNSKEVQLELQQTTLCGRLDIGSRMLEDAGAPASFLRFAGSSIDTRRTNLLMAWSRQIHET